MHQWGLGIRLYSCNKLFIKIKEAIYIILCNGKSLTHFLLITLYLSYLFMYILFSHSATHKKRQPLMMMCIWDLSTLVLRSTTNDSTSQASLPSDTFPAGPSYGIIHCSLRLLIKVSTLAQSCAKKHHSPF